MNAGTISLIIAAPFAIVYILSTIGQCQYKRSLSKEDRKKAEVLFAKKGLKW